MWFTESVTAIIAPSEPPASSAGGLLQLFRDGAPRTRAHLAQVTGLSRPTVAQRIDQLIELGLIAPVADAASTGGRPSAQLAFNPRARVVLAADLGALHARVAVTDLRGELLAEISTPREISSGPEAAISWILDSAEELLPGLGYDLSHVAGVGIGVPGPVEFSTGRPINPPIMPGWDRFDIPSAIRSRIDAPVLVDNDVNIMALGELATAWNGVTDLIFVKVASGIGAGIVSGGSLRRGANGAAGDIGHIALARAADTPCPCGNRGCLEAVASGRALARALSTPEAPLHRPSAVVALAKAGDVHAIQLIRQAGRDIGEVLTACVSIMNPSAIVIGGTMAQAAEHLVAGVREVVYARSIPLSTEQLTIAPSLAAGNAAIYGAAQLAIDAALAPERIAAALGG
ncbi:Sugar kinase of the NBD/HSP70 family, may contain an N-terminal HTH domain [Leucobacter chromiiresistens]|uniref:Sugar kinase of the NBD/HSP70 family, may contain an N-terminal HTH domain n=1 Tax=Leucobacter chromiiresistens TaxID=1079994 RepID=A0A1H0XZ03_9MICO|nr:Sugar kinase of the NBD/HSP70 family, may contain an N-terminal HTH domain [Leucobacter chromiiresistens]